MLFRAYLSFTICFSAALSLYTKKSGQSTVYNLHLQVFKGEEEVEGIAVVAS